MMSSPLAEGTRAILDTIPEGFDEESWGPQQLSDSTKAPSDFAYQGDEDEKFAEIRTRMRRETTETLISNLVSLKPPLSIVADTRLIEVGILNEDLTREKLRISVRNLLNEVNKVGKDAELTYHNLHPDDPINSPKGPIRQLRRSSPFRGRSNSINAAGDFIRDRDAIAELKMRDLRQLDNHFNNHEEPRLLVRRHCVLISLGPSIRVIVQSKRLMILVHPDGEDTDQEHTLLQLLADTVKDLMKSSRLGMDFSDTHMPFEVKAYTALFSMYHSLLLKEFNTLLCRSKSLIASISNHTMLAVGLQEFMRTNHDNVVDLLSRVNGVRRMISNLLEEDEVLYLNLKVLEQNPSIYGLSLEDAATELYSSYSDIESIVEAIQADFRTIENQTEVMARKLTNIEQSVNLRLDTSRNELLFATTILSVFATVISFSGYITGVFGMNLDNTGTIQHTPGVFYGVFFSTLSLIIIGALSIILGFQMFHILPTHAKMHKGVETGEYTGKPGERKGSLEFLTKNVMHFIKREDLVIDKKTSY